MVGLVARAMRVGCATRITGRAPDFSSIAEAASSPASINWTDIRSRISACGVRELAQRDAGAN